MILHNDHHVYWEGIYKVCLYLVPLRSVNIPYYQLIDNRARHLLIILDRLFSDAANNSDTDIELFISEDIDVIIFLLSNYFTNNNINNKINRLSQTKVKLLNTNV